MPLGSSQPIRNVLDHSWWPTNTSCTCVKEDYTYISAYMSAYSEWLIDFHGWIQYKLIGLGILIYIAPLFSCEIPTGAATCCCIVSMNGYCLCNNAEVAWSDDLRFSGPTSATSLCICHEKSSVNSDPQTNAISGVIPKLMIITLGRNKNPELSPDQC